MLNFLELIWLIYYYVWYLRTCVYRITNRKAVILHLTPFRQTLSLSGASIAASKPSCPLSPQQWGYRDAWSHLAFYVGARDLTSGPQVPTASWAKSPALC